MAIKNIFAELEEKKSGIENLSIDALIDEMAANEDLLLLDLREIQERVDLGTIPGSVHVPRGMLEFWASPASPYYRDYFQEDRRTVVFQLNEYLKDQIHKFQVVNMELPGRARHLAASLEFKGHKELISAFNKGLAAARQDGSYDAIIKKWDERYPELK